jgi:hypothetical protein
MNDPAASSAPLAQGRAVFLSCAALALALHALLLLSSDGLRAGEDMVPHLRLIEMTRLRPGLHNVYAPAYHALGALLAPLTGLAVYPRLFSFASALAAIFAFRAFQRAAGLPEASTAVFALSPYLLTVSWCIPKVEFMGHAVGLLGLAALLQRRYLALAAAVVAAFLVHTAAALVFGFAAGVLALVRRDFRALVALGAGSLASLPLFAAHLAAGCSVPQAFLFSRSGYLAKSGTLEVGDALRLLILASPLALGAAAAGGRALWRRSAPLAAMALALLLTYLNDLWLLPFGASTAAGLHRGMSVLAIPVAMAAGVATESWRSRWRHAFLGCVALWSAAAAIWVVPASCFVRPIDVAEARTTMVKRCEFGWVRGGVHRRVRPGVPGAWPRLDPKAQPPGP